MRQRYQLHRRLLVACLATALVGFGFTALADAEDAPGDAPEPTGRYKKIMVIDFEGEIAAMTWAYMKRRIDQAEAEGFDCIVLRIDSPGGTVFHSEKISNRLFELNSIHTVAWVPVKAISGACMVAMACDEIVMKNAGTIGDCQPILIAAGGAGYQEAGEKIESPLRAIFRKFAEKNGYPTILAEAFVSKNVRVIEIEAEDGTRYFVEQEGYESADDKDEIVPGHVKETLRRIGNPVVTKEQLLTLTATETVRFGFQKRLFEGPTAPFPADEAQLLAALKAPGATVVDTKPDFYEEAGRVMLAISGVLAAIVTLAAALTIFQGFGTISIIGGIALILMLLINATADQLYGFPIFLILVGFLLLAAEAFIIPGFGIAGILGVASVGTGFLFLATGSSLGDTEGKLTNEAFMAFAMQFVFSMIAGFIAIMALSRFFPKIGPARRMILAAPGDAPTTFVSEDPSLPAIGDVGYTSSALRPAGSAEFAGQLVDVVSGGTFLERGTRVRVVGVEGTRVTVAPDEA
ncbi:MAG: NfeD family protein [Planctomycetota bacterium]|nr:NfeD family protein [Planctomycetota bacterium]